MTVGLICIKSGTQILRKGVTCENGTREKKKRDSGTLHLERRSASPNPPPTGGRAGGEGGHPRQPVPVHPRLGGRVGVGSTTHFTLCDKRRSASAEAPVENGSPARGAPLNQTCPAAPRCDQALDVCAPVTAPAPLSPRARALRSASAKRGRPSGGSQNNRLPVSSLLCAAPPTPSAPPLFTSPWPSFCMHHAFLVSYVLQILCYHCLLFLVFIIY